MNCVTLEICLISLAFGVLFEERRKEEETGRKERQEGKVGSSEDKKCPSDSESLGLHLEFLFISTCSQQNCSNQFSSCLCVLAFVIAPLSHLAFGSNP